MKKKLAAITAAALLAAALPVMPQTAQKAAAQTLPYQDTSLSFEERAADLVSRMTLDEKVAQMGRNAPAISRLGISKYNYWSEALHGVARQGVATSFPISLAMSNTWDTELMERSMDIASTEARGKNKTNNHKNLSYWSPTINMARDPRWGRNDESYGEDPYLTTQLGGAAVRGMQGNDGKYLKTIATIKHYAANNNEGERQVGTSEMTESELREYYTRAFGDIIENDDPASVMSSYNGITMSRNGENVFTYLASSANPYLLTDVLRRTYGFSGYVVGDCGAWSNLYSRTQLRHNLFPDMDVDDVTMAMTTSKAVAAGNNLDCGNDAYLAAKEGVENGYITEDQVDRAVYELFLARMKTGEFDTGVSYQSITGSEIECDEHVAVAEKAAEESWVLLENKNNTLPLKNDAAKIAVVGGFADKLVLGDYSGSPTKTVTPIEGIREQLPNAEISYLSAVEDDTLLFNVKSINLVLKDGSRRKVDLSKAESVSGMKASGGTFTDVTPAAKAVIKGVDFSNVATVEAEMSTGARIGGTINIAYGNGGPTVANVSAKATSGTDTYTICSGAYTGEDGGYNNTEDMYISATATLPEFSVENFKAQLDAADYIIAYAATIPKQEGLGTQDASESRDRASIDLPAHEYHVQEICDAYPDKAIVVMSTVGQINVEPFKDKCAAMLWTSYNGQTQGTALGKVLNGEVNPSGRLSTTWYANEDLKKMPCNAVRDQSSGFDYRFADYTLTQKENFPGRTYQYYGGTPVYSFGYGKSYTDFEYSNIKINGSAAAGTDAEIIGALYNADGTLAEVTLKKAVPGENKAEFTKYADGMRKTVMVWDSIGGMKAVTNKTEGDTVTLAADMSFDANDTVTVTADVTNTGDTAGAEVAQLYVSVPGADGVNLPLKQLKGFERTELAPGETKTVTFELDLADVTFFDESTQAEYSVEGKYTVKVGRNADDENALTAGFNVSGDIADEIKNVKAVPTGIKLYAADVNGEIKPGNSIDANVSAAMKNNKLVSGDFGEISVSYASSDESVAKVDSNGIVTSGGTAGTALVTVTAEYKGKTVTDSFPVVTIIKEGVSDAVRAEYIEKLGAEYGKYIKAAYSAENWAVIENAYNDGVTAINNEPLAENLDVIIKKAADAMAAVEPLPLDKAYTLKSANENAIVNGSINYSADGIGEYTVSETAVSGTITKDAPCTIPMKVYYGANEQTDVMWFVEKLDGSSRKAPEIDSNGNLIVYEYGVFKIKAVNYTDLKYGEMTVTANLQLEGESADDANGADVTDVKEGASGDAVNGNNIGTTKNTWIRYDGVKLSKLTDITFRASQRNTAAVVNVATSASDEYIVASAEIPSTGAWTKWTEVRADVNRSELDKAVTDETGCGTIYIQTNGSNLDYVKFNYIESDMDVMNMPLGKIKVTVPYDNCVLVENRGGTETETAVTSAGEYIFDGFKDGDEVTYSVYDNMTDRNPLIAAVTVTYRTPSVKSLTVYNLTDQAFDSFFDSSAAALTSGTGLDGFGPWQTQSRSFTAEYKGKTYSFTRGLKGGRGSRTSMNLYFTPEADGKVVVYYAAAEDRFITIDQNNGEKKDYYGEGDRILSAAELDVKAGEPVYIYGGGSNKFIFAVLFDTESGSDKPTDTPEPTTPPAPADIARTERIEAESYVNAWTTNNKFRAAALTSASGGKMIENTNNDDIIYYGEYDLTKLAQIDVTAAIRADAGEASAEFFAVDISGKDIAAMDKAAINVLLTGAASIGKTAAFTAAGNWNTYGSNKFTVTANPTGRLGLFVKLSTTGKYAGNIDCIDLGYSG